MSQFDFGVIDPYVVDGIALANLLNNWRDSLYTLSKGPTRPSYIQPGQLWIDDSAGVTSWVVKQFVSAALGDVALFVINSTVPSITLSGMVRGPVVPSNAVGQEIVTAAWVNAAIQTQITAAIATVFPPGSILDFPGIITIAPAGWILSGGGTIGAALSGATIRANPDCELLFKHIWTLNNAEAPVYLNDGTATTRGATANDDWIGNRRIGGLDFRGIVRAAYDPTQSRLPFARTGMIGGAYYHYLTTTEMPSHGHGLTIGGVGLSDPTHYHNVPSGAFAGHGSGGYIGGGDLGSASVNTNGVGTGVSVALNGSWAVSANGSGSWHNNVQATRTVTTIVKL